MTLSDAIKREEKGLLEKKGMVIIDTEQAEKYGLTPREMQVMERYARGYNKNKITAELKIAKSTVENHSASIQSKLNASNRVNAVYKATMDCILTEEAEKKELSLRPTQTIKIFYTANGYTNKKTANELGIREQSVKNHLYRVRKWNNDITTERLVYLATIQYFKHCPVTLDGQGKITLAEKPIV